jgi:c-di-GMP-binding flagellar brake protein YcgR
MKDSKRKFPRVNYPCAVTVWRQDGSSEVVMANTANIGGGGMCVYFNEALSLGTILDIKIENFFEGGPLKCRGKVLRCRADSSTTNNRQRFFEIGIEFLEIDDAQRFYLVGFVERLIELESRKKT